MTKLRHESLQCGLARDPIDIYVSCTRSFKWPQYGSTNAPLLDRLEDLDSVVALIALSHLQYPVDIDVNHFVEAGVGVVLDYFTVEWWKDDDFAEREMNKARFRKGLKWFSAFSNGLFVCALAGRWDAASQICSWVEMGIETDYVDDDQEPTLGDAYKCLASALSPKPMRMLKKLEDRVIVGKKKRPRQLLRMLDATKESNQSLFDKTIEQSLIDFRKTLRRANTPSQWIATHESTFALACQHLGTKLSVEGDIFAPLVTPSTIGLKKEGKKGTPTN